MKERKHCQSILDHPSVYSATQQLFNNWFPALQLQHRWWLRSWLLTVTEETITINTRLLTSIRIINDKRFGKNDKQAILCAS